MNSGEFALFNQQLAVLLKGGLPLEGALAKLSADMQRGRLRREIQLLEADLQMGRPLAEALEARRLPDFYRQMIRAGARANDLPAVLPLLADYYQTADSAWRRLQGLMIYPLIVLAAVFVISGLVTGLWSHFIVATADSFDYWGEYPFSNVEPLVINLWMPPILTGLALLLFLTFRFVPALNRAAQWRLPVFRDAKRARVAGAMTLLLRRGGNLEDALAMVAEMEKGSRAGRELNKWRKRLGDGLGKFSEMAVPGVAFPPLFCWLVASAGEDLPAGFQRAAEIYGSRATYRLNWLMSAAPPFALCVLGAMIVWQLYPTILIVLRFFVVIID